MITKTDASRDFREWWDKCIDVVRMSVSKEDAWLIWQAATDSANEYIEEDDE
jgi:hypothetical protein